MTRVRPIALFLGCGLCVLAYLNLTVHRRRPSEFLTAPNAIRTSIELSNWRAHGYFRSYGLLMPTSDPHALYRSSTGAYRITGYVFWLVTGGDRHAQALHNQLVSLVTSVLLALLAYRIALQLGLARRHALALALGAQMVQFTFADNLALYWDMSAQAYWLPFALAFFLVGKRWQRMLIVFAMTYLEYVCATMFLAAYVLAVMFTSVERPSWKTLVLPWLAAMAIFGVQLGLAGADRDVKLIGSSFLYRTGLDGDAELYKTPLDIAFGRDIVRAQRPAAREQLFHWPVLFFAGIAAVVAIFVRARDSILPLAALIGAYVLYAAVFSQAVALHPYLYDPLLAAPLILALFAIAPARFENGAGIVTLVTFLAAVWTAFYNVRIYAMTYPLR
ncbi:MAG TPA: hypothetical protein VM733_02845 [Thermoanaerobaculia bacterium]|nr:hypothetical protein [Thermoanaerobaculia bacterium]